MAKKTDERFYYRSADRAGFEFADVFWSARWILISAMQREELIHCRGSTRRQRLSYGQGQVPLGKVLFNTGRFDFEGPPLAPGWLKEMRW